MIPGYTECYSIEKSELVASFFVKIPKSDFLALICRFWYLMTLLDHYQKTKKFGFLELKKKFSNFLQYCKITFFANIRAQKKCSNWKILIIFIFTNSHHENKFSLVFRNPWIKIVKWNRILWKSTTNRIGRQFWH